LRRGTSTPARVSVDRAGEQERTELTDYKRRVGRGAIWTTIAWVVTMVLGYPVTVLLVRVMNSATYGTLALAASIGAFAAVATGFGLGTATTLLVSESDANEGGQSSGVAVASVYGFVRIATAGAAVGSGLLIGILVSIPSLHRVGIVLVCFLPLIVLSPAMSAATGLLQSRYKPLWVSAGGVAQSGVRAVAIVVIVVAAGRHSAVAAALCQAIGVVGSAAVLLFGASHVAGGFGRSSSPAGIDSVRRVASYGSAVLLATAAVAAIAQLDVLFMGLIKGTRITGLYAPVSQLGFLVTSVSSLVAAYLLASLRGLIAQARSDETRALYHWASTLNVILMSGPISILLVVPADALDVLYGRRFLGMGTTARILGIGVALSITFGYNVVALDAHGLARVTALRSGIGLLANVLLCALLIPRYGVIGGAWSTTGSLLLINCLASWSLARRFQIYPVNTRMAATLVAFGVSLVVDHSIATHLDSVGNVGTCALVGLTSVGITGAVAFLVGRRKRSRFRHSLVASQLVIAGESVRNLRSWLGIEIGLGRTELVE
jgi:O-antigen/teichoic acid export membrane protein